MMRATTVRDNTRRLELHVANLHRRATDTRGYGARRQRRHQEGKGKAYDRWSQMLLVLTFVILEINRDTQAIHNAKPMLKVPILVSSQTWIVGLFIICGGRCKCQTVQVFLGGLNRSLSRLP
jgi:hypothetical protein